MTAKADSEVGVAVAIDPATLEAANWWYDVASRWLLLAGVLAALAACATVALAFIQWRADAIRERHANWRTSTLEVETARAKADSARANAEAGKAQAESAKANERT